MPAIISNSARSSSPSTITESDSEEELLVTVSRVEDQLVRAVDGELSHKDMQEALRDAQHIIVQIKKQNRGLLTHVADLELTTAGSNKDSNEKKLHTQISTLGSAFQFLFTPFLDSNSFKSRHKKPRFGPHDPERYADKKHKELGHIAEIYYHVDDNFHAYMSESKEFGSIFGKAAVQSHSSSIHRLKQTANQIFDLPSGLFSSAQGAAAQRMDNPRVRQLVGLLTQADQLKSIPFPPLLYENEDTSNVTQLFLNPYLIKIARVVIFGPQSLLSAKPVLIRKNSPFFGMRKVTPGSISWCAIMARFLLSPDTELTLMGVGFASQIKYQENLETYKETIIRAQLVQRPWYKHLMKTWNESLFPNHTTNLDESEGTNSDSSSHGSSADGQGDIVAKLLQQMSVSTPVDVANTHSSDEEEASEKRSNQPIPQLRPRPTQISPNGPSAAPSRTPAPPQFDHGTQQSASVDSEPDSEIDSHSVSAVRIPSASISVPVPGPSNVAELSIPRPVKNSRKRKSASSAAVDQPQIIGTPMVEDVAPRRSGQPKAVPPPQSSVSTAATKGGKGKGKKRG